MSEPYAPPVGPADGPASRPDGGGLPPKTDSGTPRPGADDSIDPGMAGEGDRGEDAGGMLGEG